MRFGFTFLSFGAAPYPTEEEKEKYLVESVEEALRGVSPSNRALAKQLHFLQTYGAGPAKLAGYLQSYSMGCSVSSVRFFASDVHSFLSQARAYSDRNSPSAGSIRELRERIRERVAHLRSPRRIGWNWHGEPVEDPPGRTGQPGDHEKTRWSITVLELLGAGREDHEHVLRALDL